VAEVGGSLADTAAIARRHKEEMVQVIADLLPPGPGRLSRAQAAALAVDGAIVRVQMDGPHGSAAAMDGLRALLDALGRNG